jgi:Putative Flp pilus-assembly TadE/G-like
MTRRTPSLGGFRRSLRRRSQLGQALIIFTFMLVAIFGAVGLAVDAGVGYFYSVSIERAAAAAALAGVPYMPKNAPMAQTRALAEAARNGYTPLPGGNSTITFPPAPAGDLAVQITVKVPTFFMAFFGVQPYDAIRTAEAGYRAPISIGQPDPQLGATASTLSGGGSSFYFLRFKGWLNDRSEGDAFTPNPASEVPHSGGGFASNDVHIISQASSNEAPAVANNDQTCSSATPGTNPLPCRGGYNYRIVVPTGVNDVEIDIYNMAFAPDMGPKTNACENTKNWPACNTNGYNYAEQDSGEASCKDAATCNVAKLNYLATEYSVFNVPDEFLRSNDQLLTQTKVLPIDTTNWDCNKGNNGAGSCPGTTNPTYMNVNTGSPICQAYNAAATTTAGASNGQPLPTPVINVASTAAFPAGSTPLSICTTSGWDAVTCTGHTATQFTGCSGGTAGHTLATGLAVTAGAPDNASPTNMLVYHAWADAINYLGSKDVDTAGNKLVTHSYIGCGSPCTVNGGTTGLGAGTYRVRADALQYDGTIGTQQKGSKGYAIRAFHKGGALCSECTVAAWEDVCVFSPIGSAGATTVYNAVPLFELTKDYAGSTINVDIFDVGDGSGSGTVDLALLDPTSGAASPNNYFQLPSGVVPINHNGINESGIPLNPHVPPQNPPPAPLGSITNTPFQSNWAKYRAADSSGPLYQGGWVRVALAIPSTYAPAAFPNDFWSLQYGLTNVTMDDTFTLSVSAVGGPVRIIKG